GFAASGVTIGSAVRRWITGVTGVAVRGGFSRTTSVDWSAKPGPRRETSRKTDDKNDRYQDEGACPRQLVELLVRVGGVGEDLKRKSCNRLPNRGRPELIAQRREEQGCRLAGDPGHSHERTRH